MRRTVRLIAALVLVCTLLPLPAAAANKLSELNLDSWSTSDGLPHNLIQDIAQTPDGYLWLATWSGVARFNGLEFHVFDGDNTPTIGNSGVKALAVDQQGGLWLATSRDGLARYAGGHWQSYTTDDGLAANQVLSLLVDSDNRVWAGTEEHGVSVFDGTTFRSYDEQLLGATVLDVAQAADGAIWVATRRGVNVINGDRVTALGENHGLPKADVLALLVVGEQVFAGTEQGLYRWRGDRFVADPRWRQTGAEAVAELYTDGDGYLYVGTFAKGMYRLRDDQVERLDTTNGLPNNRVWSLLIDRENNLWVGTSGGLARMQSAPFAALTMRAGLSDNYVRAVADDAFGNLWIATSNGLTRLRDQQSTILGVDEGTGTDSFLSLADAGDSMWVGTYGAGVVQVRDDQVVRRLMAPEIPSNHVRSVYQGTDGALWVGTVAGLARLQDGQLRNYTIDDGLPRSYVHSLFEDRSGRLWVGTSDGMAWFENEMITSLNGSEGLPEADVFDFMQDPDGDVWIASESGLLRYRDTGDGLRRFDRIGPEHGLPHPVLFSVLHDDQGKLWLSSNGGIFRATMSTVKAVMDGTASHVNFERFTEDEGLPSTQANGGTQPAGKRLRDGRLAFATAQGLAVVDPSRVDQTMASAVAPQPVIEQVEVDYRSVDVRRQPIVEPDARRLDIRYIGLNLRSPETVRYRHRLIGYDDRWSEAVNDRSAQFTNLPPGEYRFEVVASAPLTGWSEAPAVVRFSVRPHLHQTWWFRTLLLIGAVALIWAGLRWRTASLRSRADELVREVEHRTRHLRSQTQRLLETSREKTELLKQLEEQSAAFAQQAREDSLTGLHNRRHFDELLSKAFANAKSRSQSLSVALLDVDLFKRVNDGFGHETGDEVLRRITSKLRQHLEPFNAEVGRYGGEEFAMMFIDMAAVTAAELCEQLRRDVAAMDFSDLHQALQVTVSIGISDRLDVPSHEKMLSLADQRLYDAKRGGRNQVRL